MLAYKVMLCCYWAASGIVVVAVFVLFCFVLFCFFLLPNLLQ